MPIHRQPPRHPLSRLQSVSLKAGATAARRGAMRIDPESATWKLREARMWLAGGAHAVLNGTHKGGEQYLSAAVATARRAGMADEDILAEVVEVLPVARVPERIRAMLERADG